MRLRRSFPLSLVTSLALAGGGCERRPGAEPAPVSVAAKASDARVEPAPSQALSNAPIGAAAPGPAPVPAVPASAAPAASAALAAGGAPEAATGAGNRANAETTGEAALVDGDGKPLPQTEEHPRVDTASFQRRIERLAQAIIVDDPSLAHPSFFPLLAYQQVKAVAKPERDYQFRLIKAFDREVHEYHASLGADAAGARLSGIDVPDSAARWMKPGSEGNRLGYFRVLRSRLRLKKVDGKEQSFEVTSMISWRGEWYVVHLHGFE